MKKHTKTILLIAAFALFIGLAVFAYRTLSPQFTPPSALDTPENGSIDQAPPTAAPDEEEQEEEKIAAPDFTVLDSEGNTVQLSDMLGKPIVLNFWASWCPPCKGEMPDFDSVYAELGEEVAFMMVDLVDGQRETKETGATYVEDQGFSFPVYFDTEQDAAAAYGISSIPTTFFIDKDGYIIAGAQQALDAETLRKGIDLIK